MDAADLAFAGLAKQAALVRAGEVSSRELVELYLDRIARIDPQLNSYSVVLAERALIEADQADSRHAAGDDRPLLGVPVAIKDNVDVAGTVTTGGTAAHGPPASEDAELVRRLRAAGCVILGKTTLPELAIMGTTEGPAFGVTRNPWDTDRTPGGSSGGSAAAGHATDGAGSIRIPAACCGLFGLKPQRGRVPLAPDDEDHWNGLSVAGAVTHTVLDNALFLDAVAGPLAGAVFAAMPRRARWVIYGRLDQTTTPIPEPGQMIFMHKRIEGFWLPVWMREASHERRKHAFTEAQKRFADGRWVTDVTAIVPLSEAVSRVPGELAKPNGKVFISP